RHLGIRLLLIFSRLTPPCSFLVCCEKRATCTLRYRGPALHQYCFCFPETAPWIVSVFLKQLPGTLDNFFFCLSNAIGNLGSIRFKNCSSIKCSPVRNLGLDKGTHNYHPEDR